MNRFLNQLPILLTLVALLSYGIFFAPASLPAVFAQQPTETPVTSMFITVITEEPQINVRMGPSSSVYPIVGTLPTGSVAPALGRSLGGDWIQIQFPGAPNNLGWVYSPLVSVSPGTLRIAEPPPTPVPPATSTIDPAFAEQFKTTPTSARLPTFTPPPTLVVTTYTQAPLAVAKSPVSLGIIIITLALLGFVGFVLSLFVRR